MWWSRAGELHPGGGGGSVDRDGGSGFGGVVLASWRQVAAVDLSTETAAVGVVESCWRAASRWRRWICRQRRRQWLWWSRAGELEAGGGGGSVDRDGGSWCFDVMLVSLRQEAVVDLSTETAAVTLVALC